MPEPNPIWGLHVAPGAIAGALVRRAGDGYEVMDSFVSDAPADAIQLIAATRELVRRTGVAGRASLTAIPDHELAVCTGTIPSDELYLNDEEIYHHLHDFAPFEPGEGQMAYRAVGGRDERKYLVAAIPPDAQDALDGMAEVLDDAFHGIGLATPALVRGARALGLVDGRTFLVDVQAAQTIVVAVEGDDERRYILALGMAHCRDSMGQAELLARDLLRILSYHAEVACREAPEDHEPARADVVCVGAHAARAHELLRAGLGDRLAPPSQRGGKPERLTDATGAPLPNEIVHAQAGAIGAALEGLAPAETRFVLRHPPMDVPEYVEPVRAPPEKPSRVLLYTVVAILVAAALLAAWAAFTPESRRLPEDTPSTRESPTEGGAIERRGLAEGDEQAALDASEGHRARGAEGDFAILVT